MGRKVDTIWSAFLRVVTAICLAQGSTATSEVALAQAPGDRAKWGPMCCASSREPRDRGAPAGPGTRWLTDRSILNLQPSLSSTGQGEGRALLGL